MDSVNLSWQEKEGLLITIHKEETNTTGTWKATSSLFEVLQVTSHRYLVILNPSTIDHLSVFELHNNAMKWYMFFMCVFIQRYICDINIYHVELLILIVA